MVHFYHIRCRTSSSIIMIQKEGRGTFHTLKLYTTKYFLMEKIITLIYGPITDLFRLELWVFVVYNIYLILNSFNNSIYLNLYDKKIAEYQYKDEKWSGQSIQARKMKNLAPVLCHYTGNLRDSDGSSVALSLCDSLVS